MVCLSSFFKDYENDCVTITLKSREITEMNWEGAPKNLKEIYLHNNQITEINWKGVPESLQSIWMNNNQITEMNWEGVPKNLKEIALGNNQLSELNWQGAPESLHTIYLHNNQISEINWKKVPKEVVQFHIYGNLIPSIDWTGAPSKLQMISLFGDTEITSEIHGVLPRRMVMLANRYYEERYRRYELYCIIQRLWRRKYFKKARKATIIQRACHNWIWKPVCRDGSIGIRPRLDMKELGIDQD